MIDVIISLFEFDAFENYLIYFTGNEEKNKNIWKIAVINVCVFVIYLVFYSQG